MPKPTKIERVEPMLWDRWLLVRIACEDGTVGIGEGGVHGGVFAARRLYPELRLTGVYG